MPQMFGGGMPSGSRPPSQYQPDWSGALQQAVAQNAPDYFSRTSGGGSPQGLANTAVGALGPQAPFGQNNDQALQMAMQFLGGGGRNLPAVAPMPGQGPTPGEVRATAGAGATPKQVGGAPTFLAGLTGGENNGTD